MNVWKKIQTIASAYCMSIKEATLIVNAYKGKETREKGTSILH